MDDSFQNVSNLKMIVDYLYGLALVSTFFVFIFEKSQFRFMTSCTPGVGFYNLPGSQDGHLSVAASVPTPLLVGILMITLIGHLKSRAF